MRISTASMHQTAISAMLRQQAELSKTQGQIASGKRVQTPADDPVAAVQLQDLARLQSQQQQFNTNSVSATGRLRLEEQSLADATTLLQRTHELVLQANSDTLTDEDRQYIVAELRTRISELQGIANRRDAAGDYLFSGYKADVPAFQRDAAGVMRYGGDSFTVAPAGTTDVFAALDALVNALGQGGAGDAASARLHSRLNASLQQIDQSLDHLSGVRAEVGGRLALLDDLQATREARLADIASSMSDLGDLDYAEAVSRMNQQSVNLQAAQQSYAAIAKLSLFDYL